MNKIQKLILGCSVISLLIMPHVTSITEEELDFDPLIDLSITIDIKKVRSLEHDDPQLHVPKDITCKRLVFNDDS
jgi:hypothetical protein